MKVAEAAANSAKASLVTLALALLFGERVATVGESEGLSVVVTGRRWRGAIYMTRAHVFEEKR